MLTEPLLAARSAPAAAARRRSSALASAYRCMYEPYGIDCAASALVPSGDDTPYRLLVLGRADGIAAPDSTLPRQTPGARERQDVRMDITGPLVYDHPPTDVFAMFVDADYVRARAEATGGRDIEAEVTSSDGTVEITNSRSIVADVPSFARSMVGDSIRITETHVWGPDAGGSREGTFEAKFGTVPVTLRGRLKLVPDGAGSIATLEGQIKATVPLVGRKIEQLVHDQVAAALVIEQELGNSWLAD